MRQKKRLLAIAIAALFCGCAQDRSVIQITCQPRFEHEMRPELVVTGPDGDRADAMDRTLVLSRDGEQYRIPWGTPPVSQGPVELSQHQTYTFSVDTERAEVLSIHEGETLIYASPDPEPSGDATAVGDTLLGTWRSIEFSGPELGALESVVAKFDAGGSIEWVGTYSDGARTQHFSYRVEGDRLVFEFEHEESAIPYAYEVQGDVLRMRALRHTARFVFERVRDD